MRLRMPGVPLALATLIVALALPLEAAAQGAAAFTVSTPSLAGTFGWSDGMMVPVYFRAALTFDRPTAVPVGAIQRH